MLWAQLTQKEWYQGWKQTSVHLLVIHSTSLSFSNHNSNYIHNLRAKTQENNNMFWSLFIFQGHSAQESASNVCNDEQGDLFYFAGQHRNKWQPQETLGRGFGKNAGENPTAHHQPLLGCSLELWPQHKPVEDCCTSPHYQKLSPPQISINSTKPNGVEHFIYLGSFISNDVTVTEDLDNCLLKASSSFGRLSESMAVIHTAPLQRSTFTEPLLFLPSCTVHRPGFSTGSRSCYFSSFTHAVCTPSLVSNGQTTHQTKFWWEKPACQV